MRVGRAAARMAVGTAVLVLLMIAAAGPSAGTAIVPKNGRVAGVGANGFDIGFKVIGHQVQQFDLTWYTGPCSHGVQFNPAPGTVDSSGRFDVDDGVTFEVKGRFTTPTKVHGKLIYNETNVVCGVGTYTFKWNARWFSK